VLMSMLRDEYLRGSGTTGHGCPTREESSSAVEHYDAVY
jgi:hypothetical protein